MTTMKRPINDYDVEGWMAYYAANPGMLRAVGADAADGGDAAGDAAGNGGDAADGSDAGGDNLKAGDGDDKQKAGEGDDSLKGGDGEEKSKISDDNAKLLKDLMKHKKTAREAQDALKALKSQVGDIDLDEAKKILADKKKAEEQAALDRGEFDKIRQQMVDQHKTEIDKLNETIAALQGKLDQGQKVIGDLTVGTAFSTSKYLQESVVVPPAKMRKLYQGHFDIAENGSVVGYDKPAGEEGRAPLVNATGDPVSFDEAIQRIIGADPDKDSMLKAQLNPGAGSKPGKGKPSENANLTGMERIKKGLSKLAEAEK